MKKTVSKQTISHLFFEKKGLLFIFFLSYLIFLLSQLSVSFSIYNIINLTEKASDHSYLIFTIILTVTTILVFPTFGYLTSYLEFKISKNIRDKLTNTLIHEILSSENEYINKNNSAYYLSLFVNDIRIICDDFIVNFLDGIGYIFLLIGSITYLLFINYIIALVIVFSAIITFIFPLLNSKTIDKKRVEMLDAQELFVNKIKDTLNFFSLIKVYNIEKKEENDVNTYNSNQTKKDMKFKSKKEFVSSISSGLGFGTQLFIFGIGILLVNKNIITVAAVISAIQTINYVLSSFKGILNASLSYIGVRPVIKKLDIFIFDNSKHINRTKELKKSKFNIKLNMVSFAYNDKEVISKYSDVINFGQKVLVTGNSGAGKSTLLRLISGLYYSYLGSILVDDIEIKEIDESYYKFCAFVQQETMLFHDTLKNNITLGQNYDDNHYHKILQMVGLDEVIKKFDNHDNEIILDNGKNISSGERQRIGLARALIKSPSLLILDECFSNLDVESTEKVMKNIFSLPCTILEVSHLKNINLSLYDKKINL